MAATLAGDAAVKMFDNKLIAWGTIALPVLTAASLAIAIVVERTGALDAIAVSQRIDQDHETRLRVIESVVGDMRSDVRETKTHVEWIRRFLDRPPAAAPADPGLNRVAAP
jgi:hypothetical protein